MSRRLQRVTDWAAVAADCGYRIQQIAHKYRVSERTVHRYIRRRFKTKPKRWLDELRAQVAAQQLADGESIKNVAKHCKFAQPQNFTKFFKRVRGSTPRTYLGN